MSLDKILVFSRPLKSVTLEYSGAAPVRGDALREELKKGYELANDKFNAQLLQMRKELQEHANGVLTKVETAYAQLTASLAEALPELIAASVYKVIGERAMDPAVLRSRIETVVAESCPTQTAVEVNLNPQDLETLNKLDENYASRHTRLSFKADETLEKGDCVMQTKFGKVDARLKTQLARLVQELAST